MPRKEGKKVRNAHEENLKLHPPNAGQALRKTKSLEVDTLNLKAAIDIWHCIYIL